MPLELAFSVQGQPISVGGLILLGSLAGLVAGLFGVGGGFLLTPMLNVVFGIPIPIAVGTGLCLMIGTAVPALLRRRAEGQGELRFDFLMLGGSLLGVDAGTRSLDALTRSGTIMIAGRPQSLAALVVQTGYVLLLVGAAVLFWREGHGKGAREPLRFVRRGPLARIAFGPRVDLPSVPLRDVSVLPIAYLGFALGFLAGLLGIGGSVALMPVLIHGYGFPLHQAAGTGILVLVVSATLATLRHAMLGHVHLGVAGVLLVGASLTTQIGVLASRRLPVRLLRRLFAAVLVAAAMAVAWNLARG